MPSLSCLVLIKYKNFAFAKMKTFYSKHEFVYKAICCPLQKKNYRNFDKLAQSESDKSEPLRATIKSCKFF